MSQSDTPVWFITGCSTGFGRELARLVLERGWRAVVTARNPDQVADLVKGREVRALFEANFFGLVAMTRAVLPGMRARRSGCIVNISSIGGLASFPGTGYYHATKYAVEGLSDSLAQELAPLGVRVIIVEPGPFRTNWAGGSLKKSVTRIADYDATAGSRRAQTEARSGRRLPVRR